MTRFTILSFFAVAVLCVQSAQAQYYPGYHIDYVPHGNHYHAVPHTTTHYDAVPHYNNHWGPSIVPHGNHYHRVPYTTTHCDVVNAGFGHNPHWGHRQAMPKWIKSTERVQETAPFFTRVVTLPKATLRQA